MNCCQVMPEIFEFYQGTSPLLISFPHDGVAFPSDLRPRLSEVGLRNVDCDWFICKLYSFIEKLDVSYLKPAYSRYVVDLNRSAEGELLYPGKMETSICPQVTFDGEPVYRNGEGPTKKEIQSRIESYWQVYHDHIKNELERIKSIHAYAILWDAHSIRAEVPLLFDGVLPELNFGTNDGQSCQKQIVDKLVAQSEEYSNYSVVLNGRFKGGYITRHYGDPENNIHAIQLEINQSTYLTSSTGLSIDNEKTNKLSNLLERLVILLIDSV